MIPESVENMKEASIGASAKPEKNNADAVVATVLRDTGAEEPAKEDLASVVPDEKLYIYGIKACPEMNVNRPGTGAEEAPQSLETDYQFIPLRDMVNDERLEKGRKALYGRIVAADSEAYDLDEKARELQALFHVEATAFDPNRDRECEIGSGFMHKAYMLHGLRSFAWTLADYCKRNNCAPDAVHQLDVVRIVGFVASRHWLNYDGVTYCQGLCGGSDLHVYFVPDAVVQSDREQLLFSMGRQNETGKQNGVWADCSAFPCEVHSLNALRKDLEYIYPAIKVLGDFLEQSSFADEALLGNKADIVYAWCVLALAAQRPFFSEEGPSMCFFRQPIDWDTMRDNLDCTPAKQWMRKYKKYLEKNPRIDFNGKRFVFSGFGLSFEKTSDPIVQGVIDRGGLYRTSVSGVTDYLVVNPCCAGTSKTAEAVEQMKKGKNIKIILATDLKKPFAEVSPVKKALPSSQVLSGKESERTITDKDKVDAIVIALKSRYQNSCARPGSLDELISENPDLQVADLKVLTLVAYNEEVGFHLAKEGLLPVRATNAFAQSQKAFQNESYSVEAMLESVTEALRERYTSGKERPHHLKDLRAQNPDLPISKIGYWSKAVFGQSADEYLTAQGILKSSNAVQEQKQSQVRKQIDTSKKVEREKIAAQLAAPLEEQRYEAPVYQVEEIDISGDEVSDWEYYVSPDSELYLVDYRGSREHIVLPVTINGKKVKVRGDSFVECEAQTIEIPGAYKSIPDGMGRHNNHLKTLIIGEGITEIGNRAFERAEHLENLYVSRSVAMIHGADAFYSIPWLANIKKHATLGSVYFRYRGDDETLNIPRGVKTVASHVMQINYSVTVRKVIIPDTVITLCDEAFDGSCDFGIREFVFTDSVQYIGCCAFGSENEWLEQFGSQAIVINNMLYRGVLSKDSMAIPEGVTRICGGAFKKNDRIKSVVLPKSLRRIEQEAFAECRSLTSIDLPEGVEWLGKKCFYNCLNLKTLCLPDSLAVVGDSAFASCESLGEISLGAKEIGQEAFANCKALISVTMKNGVCTIGDGAFRGCSNLSAVALPDSVVGIGSGAFESCVSLREISIPQSVVEISEKAFNNCKQLKEVSSGSQLQKIGKEAFQNCAALEKIVLPPRIGSRAFDGCSSLRSVAFPDGTKEIAYQAFAYCSALTELTLPDSVVKIGGYAFFRCGSIARLILPSQLRSIGNCAFKECKALKSVVIPESVSTIEYEAFRDCSSLESVVIPESVGTIEREAFRGCSSLKSVAIPTNIEKLGMDVFADCSSLHAGEDGDFVAQCGVLLKYRGQETKVTIPDNIIVLGDGAFEEAPQVKELIIPDTVKIISANLMGKAAKKPKLEKLVIGNCVTTIGESAFANCRALKKVSFGNSLTTIGREAFSCCDKLTCIDLETTAITDIQDWAFSECRRVKKLRLPTSLETIGSYAFKGVTLKRIQLPKSVKSVDQYAFSHVTELVVYDTIDPVNDQGGDRSNKSSLYCATLQNAGAMWSRRDAHYITVMSAETETVRYRIFCNFEEGTRYHKMLSSAWGGNASFDFEKYDEYFMKVRSPIDRLEMAICRLQYPEGLTEEHGFIYKAYLERCMYFENSAKEIANFIAGDDLVEVVEILDQYKAIDAHNLEWIRAVLHEMNAKECLEYLDGHF